MSALWKTPKWAQSLSYIWVSGWVAVIFVISCDETKEAGRYTVLEVDGGESLYRCNRLLYRQL